jgi:ABC-type lipoprotein export system ATPase subunit
MLSVDNVLKSFRLPDGSRLPILNVPRFSADKAEQLALVGQSGGGKTTLLHVIAGITRPDSGSVTINGTNITALAEAGRDRFRARHIGYVFQTFNLLPGFTALENVLLGMSFVGESPNDDRARALLERVGLAGRLHHKPSMLSVGEQQRTAVARALANRPKLLLADEPTASIDARHQQQVLDLIRRTCREDGVTLIVVTHSPQVAEQFERVERLESINRPAVEAETV